MSSSQRIFITGATGYIGGHTITRLLEKYPEFEANITVLVRDENQKKMVTDRWSNIRCVIGTLDDTELLKSEAAKHEIVLRKCQNSKLRHIIYKWNFRNCLS